MFDAPHTAPGVAATFVTSRTEALISPEILRAATLAAALGAGLSAGVFFAFSSFVMRAIGDLPPVQAIRAMQSINVQAPSPLFMAALFGTALLCIVLAAVSLGSLSEPAARLRVVAAGSFLVAIVLTAAYHVPHNDALAAVHPTAANAAQIWSDYAGGWTLLNHVRTLACLVATGALVWAVRVG